MISCIIIDDEKKARETFEKIVERYLNSKLKVVYSAETVKQGVSAIHKFHPDLVFLDIELPGENGFKLFEYFDKVPFDVIFLSAFQNYAIDAVKRAAFDYILKPLDQSELNEVITRFENKKKEKDNLARVQTLLSNLNSGNDHHGKIALPTLSGYLMEKITNIIYCEADENYTKIHNVNGKTVVVSRTLKVVEELLPPEYFFRIHKSFLINLNFVSEYNRVDGHRVILENGDTLEVATRRIEEFVNVLTKSRV